MWLMQKTAARDPAESIEEKYYCPRKKVAAETPRGHIANCPMLIRRKV